MIPAMQRLLAPGVAAVAIGSALSSLSSPVLAKSDGIETAGNVLKFALPVAGAALNLAHDDADGALQLGVSWLGAFGSSFLLQQLVREERPDNSGMDAFPSDSTATAFAAASSIQVRYGWNYGLPAYAVAAFVGYSRIEADKHHWHDVAVGALIGWGIGQLLTSRYQRLPEIQAYADAKGGRFQASWHW